MGYTYVNEKGLEPCNALYKEKKIFVYGERKLQNLKYFFYRLVFVRMHTYFNN